MLTRFYDRIRIFINYLIGFPFEPTLKQDAGLQQLASFITSLSKQNIFLLKGYAGTGKTTIIGTIVKNIWKAKKKCHASCANR